MAGLTHACRQFYATVQQDDKNASPNGIYKQWASIFNHDAVLTSTVKPSMRWAMPGKHGRGRLKMRGVPSLGLSWQCFSTPDGGVFSSQPRRGQTKRQTLLVKLLLQKQTSRHRPRLQNRCRT